MSYYNKYLLYKKKYLSLKAHRGGAAAPWGGYEDHTGAHAAAHDDAHDDAHDAHAAAHDDVHAAARAAAAAADAASWLGDWRDDDDLALIYLSSDIDAYPESYLQNLIVRFRAKMDRDPDYIKNIIKHNRRHIKIIMGNITGYNNEWTFYKMNEHRIDPEERDAYHIPEIKHELYNIKKLNNSIKAYEKIDEIIKNQKLDEELQP